MAEPHSLPSLLLLLLLTLSVPLLQGTSTTTTTTHSASSSTATGKDNSSTATTHSANSSTTTGGTSSTLKITANANSTNTSDSVTTPATSHVTYATSTRTQTVHVSTMISSPNVSEAVTGINNHTGSTYSMSNFTTHYLNRTETTYNASIPGDTHEPYKGLSDNPGLVAVICIFVCLLCIALTVVAVKFCQKNDPEFKKLDEVPMNGMNEEAPFARYPPK